MRKIDFITDNYYHIYNRGVDKRDVFLNKSDYYRFIHDLYEFNDENPASNIARRVNVRGSTSHTNKKRVLLIDIICYCLMPNHFHLILKQKREFGIVKFMQKLGTGYTMYFNKKYERTASLFGNRFKATLIEKDEYLLHLSRYIHLNPVELMDTVWQNKKFNEEVISKFLEEYKWSSYRDYIGKRSFPSVINNRVIADYFNTQEDYKKFVSEYTIENDVYIKDLIVADE